MSWSLKKYSRGFEQFFTIKEADDTVKDISGYTITLKVQMGNTLLISSTCTIASGSLGYAYYAVQSGDFPYAGRAIYELELVKDTERIPSETYAVHVGRSL